MPSQMKGLLVRLTRFGVSFGANAHFERNTNFIKCELTQALMQIVI